MKNILLPTDFSDNSFHAISHALKLFSEEKCRFYLLHSYASIVDNMDHMQISPAQIKVEKSAKTASQERLSSFHNRIETSFNNSHHSFETISGSDTITQEVKDVVKKKHIDYVVMGTKGATGSKEVLFGSNTVHVFKDATCPVLVIPKNAEYKTLQDILFPTDFEVEYQDQNVASLTEMAKKYNSQVHVFHVGSGDKLSKKQQVNRLKLKSYLNNISHDFHDVGNESVSTAINDFMSEKPVDMLVMINNKHSFFENLFFKSRVDNIGFHIHIPFLVIPS
ncbi:universal stress protein [Bizionia argentinensis JUB59]|uniref:Universal stress protein n=1 Tax=Bizionia argentinensis JUB59 TaxID=1046627 RepID=G2EDN9_9FLAO|nr:universal stress protein [Bizionia argentinensis]EGV43443.1 universal stress protein [Bizionia argentinensis JUB59]